jgi:branched-chain amino acid transport system substrate-binding protein
LAGSEAWEGFDKKISGAINAVFEIGNIGVSKHALSLDYYSKYEKRWGKTVQEQHGPAPSYETPYILKTAIERAGSLDADAIVAALEKTDHMGCYGRIKFGPTHQAIFTNDPPTGGTSAQIQWREGGRRAVVYPASVASDRIMLPAGLKVGK